MKHNFDLKSIRLVLLDVDGVLTDGRIGLLSTGEEINFFSIFFLSLNDLYQLQLANIHILPLSAKDDEVRMLYPDCF